MNIAIQSRHDEIVVLLQRLFQELSPQLQGYKVVLFGSRAAGRAAPRSDFDLGVLGAGPLPLKVFYQIEDKLEALPSLYKIDWVDLNRASDDFRQRALEHVEVLYG